MKLILSILITLATGSIAGWLTAGESSGEWYQQLNKPWFNPPGYVFGPVWTTLYILMGIALFLVWKQPKTSQRNKATGMFAVQLIFNFFWSLIFFKMHNLTLALIEIIVLWVCILMTIFMFGRLSKAAAWLMVPYISWVSFATILTSTIWMLNR
jgi:tryptophan-rich sensory protein